jgi:hypothetical protein
MHFFIEFLWEPGTSLCGTSLFRMMREAFINGDGVRNIGDIFAVQDRTCQKIDKLI